MDVFSGASVTLWVEFQTSLGLIVADQGSVVVSLYDHTGAALVTDQAVPTDPGATGVSVTFDAAHQTIAVSRRFEKRAVWVRWTSNGAKESHGLRLHYRVVPFPAYTATPADVRTFLGLNEDELSDLEIDLFTAWLAVENEVGAQKLADALTSGTILEQHANQAIMLTAALAVMPSVRMRTLMSVSDGSNTFQRFRDAPAYEELANEARSRLGHVQRLLKGEEETAPTMLVFTTPTDPVTGA